MRAIRYYGPGDIRLEDIPEPQVKEGQVKIKVAWNGICGSDLHAYFSILPVTPTTLEPHVVTGETLPIGMGHEFSGTISEIGPGVDAARFRVGQNVVVEPLLSCNKPTCPFCAAGSRNLCRHATFVGLGGGGGGLAEYTCVDQRLVHPLPAGIPLDVGALMEPLAVAWHAVKRGNVKPGDHVLILGAGPIGLLTLRVARALGASWIAISEPASKRRALAAAHGADVVYDPTSAVANPTSTSNNPTSTSNNPTTTSPAPDIPTAIRQATGSRGADVVFDCAGTQQTLDTALQAVRPRGCVVNVAVWEAGARPVLDVDAVTYKEVVFTGVLGYDRDHPEMLRAVAAGKLGIAGLESLITRRIGLEDFVDKGIRALIHEKDQHVKILVYPSRDRPTSESAGGPASSRAKL